MEPEHSDVKEILESRGIACQLFTTKRLLRNQLLLDNTTLVVGDHPTMLHVFKRLGIVLTNDSYPESLRKYLKRTVWESNIRKLLTASHGNEISNLFVKPKSKAKLFTGFVIQSNLDLYRLDGIGKETELYCAPGVLWLSEYRVFVNKSGIVGVKHYAGDPNVALDMQFVQNAITDFEQSNQRTDGYGIDFGVLEDGTTALVEWNDGFALGSYGLDKEVYTDLILSRWNELIQNALQS